MKRILHISCDFPDAVNSDKTRAVSRLVEAADNFSHTVFSLNRTSIPFRTCPIGPEAGVYSLFYFALPFGIGLKYSLARTAKKLKRLIDRDDQQFDLIHAHKLTFEGLVAKSLAAQLGIPFVTTFRGDTDLKVIRYKPTYRATYQEVLEHSAATFFLAPWSQQRIGELWPDTVMQRPVILPNIVSGAPAASAQQTAGSRRLLSVFHLKDYRRKNLQNLLRAINLLNRRGIDVTLDIIGGGDAGVRRRVDQLVQASGCPDKVHLLGHLPPDGIADRMSNYAGLVLPSNRETFGMVFIEALQNGLPIIHSKDTGVDGYFENAGVAVAVNPRLTESIATGIEALLEQETELKQNLASYIAADGLQQFQRETIVTTYTSTIQSLLSD